VAIAVGRDDACDKFPDFATANKYDLSVTSEDPCRQSGKRKGYRSTVVILIPNIRRLERGMQEDRGGQM